MISMGAIGTAAAAFFTYLVKRKKNSKGDDAVNFAQLSNMCKTRQSALKRYLEIKMENIETILTNDVLHMGETLKEVRDDVKLMREIFVKKGIMGDDSK